MTGQSDALRRLEPLVGEWTIEAPDFAGAPPGRAVFEWVLGGAYLLQRSQAPDPAPDGHMLHGYDEHAGRYMQHYFDSRGVSRVYKMSFEDGVWRLWRDEPDFSPLDFHQRYAGTFGEDGRVIDGAWESSHDAGATWARDFRLIYRRA